jgi:hypothetical protein
MNKSSSSKGPLAEGQKNVIEGPGASILQIQARKDIAIKKLETESPSTKANKRQINLRQISIYKLLGYSQ